MDVYLHENSKTYRACEIQNNAHRSSLERKTLGLELERKKTSLYLSREEHQLREQLKQMKMTKAKNELAHNARGTVYNDKTILEHMMMMVMMMMVMMMMMTRTMLLLLLMMMINVHNPSSHLGF